MDLTNLLLTGEPAKKGMPTLQGRIARRIEVDWAVHLPYSGYLHGKITIKCACSPCGIYISSYTYNSNMQSVHQADIKVEDGLAKPDPFRTGRSFDIQGRAWGGTSDSLGLILAGECRSAT